ncbi:hypothetical protein HanPI659440_Chr02g0049011 [Helianthus annuus]|nr:hypothetical protein HanPI659440_Chr02g0049011 [Helianthus annuus]
MVKGCFMRMGYKGYVNTTNLHKSSISRPYKFFMHVVIHALGHRKGGISCCVDYIMCMIAALTLNLSYSFSKVIFEKMKGNLTPDRWLMHPRFEQMLLNHLLPNLEKKSSDLLKLEHMNNLSLDQINNYKNQAKEDIPFFKRLIGAFDKEEYVAPRKDRWRENGSNSDNEDKQMEGFKKK